MFVSSFRDPLARAAELPDFSRNLDPDDSSPPGLTGLDDGVSHDATAAWLAPLPQARGSEARKQAIVDRALGQLRDLAADPAHFYATLTQAFGAGIDRRAAEAIRQKLLAGDTSWLPKIELASADELADARGAYAADRQTVFINEDIRSPKRAAEVLIEELGHHLDQRLNRGRDAAGDEGEIFRRLVAGETLSDLELHRLRAEDDHGTMKLAGETVEVENWGLPSWIIPWFLRSKPVQETLEGIRDNLIQYFAGFDARIKAAAKGWMDDLVANAKAYGPELLKSMKTVGQGFQKLAAGDLAGGLADIAKGVASSTIDSAHAFARLTLDTISAVQTALGIEPVGRQLTGPEVERLRAIYGDSIDYSKVTVKEGDAGAFFGPRALTMGNTIYMKAHTSFTTLVHEMGHVWQFQNGGNDYMLKAGGAQLWNWMKGNEKEVAYDWTLDIRRGWAALNPEQQAEMMESIARTGYVEVKRDYERRWAEYRQREAEYQARYGAAKPTFARSGVGAGLGRLPGLSGGSVITFDSQQLRERRALDAERAALDSLQPPKFEWKGGDYTADAEDALWRVRNRIGAP